MISSAQFLHTSLVGEIETAIQWVNILIIIIHIRIRANKYTSEKNNKKQNKTKTNIKTMPLIFMKKDYCGIQ